MLHHLKNGEEETLYPFMQEITTLLYSEWIYPSQEFTFKEMCEAYVLIAPEYQPVIEQLRAHPVGQQSFIQLRRKRNALLRLARGAATEESEAGAARYGRE
jgi:hypothetical protein